MLDELRPYNFRFLNDGFVSFGFAWYDKENPGKIEEVYLNGKKEIVIKNSQDAVIDEFMKSRGLRQLDQPKFLGEFPTIVLDLRNGYEVFPKQFAEFNDDEMYLPSRYLPELIKRAGFELN